MPAPSNPATRVSASSVVEVTFSGPPVATGVDSLKVLPSIVRVTLEFKLLAWSSLIFSGSMSVSLGWTFERLIWNDSSDSTSASPLI